ncbi:MAG: DUF6056 family protein [Bacteroidales bacterium]|nr:DUF6056 family protein [Bacteroidales bacterium]
MRHFFRQFTKYDYLFFAICGIVYYLLVRQYIPCCLDDLYYSSVCGEEEYNYIDNLKEVLISNWWSYNNWNGRFLVHCFVQFFCGYGGAETFFVFSTFMFILLLMSLLYLIRRRTHSRIDKYWLLLGMLLLIPLPGVMFYGAIAFVVNYMWSAAVYTFFLCIYFHIKEDNIQYPWWKNVLIILFALVCGSWQESFCIGIAGALFFYHIFHLKNTRSTLLYLVLAFGIGACFAIFAPGNFVRVGKNELTIFKLIHTIIQILKHVPPTYIIAVLAIVSFLIDKKRNIHPTFIQDNILFFLAPLFAILFALILAYNGETQFTLIAICSIVLCIRFIYRYIRLSQKAEYVVAGITIVLCITTYIPAYWYRQQLYNSFEKTKTTYNQNDYCVDGEFEHFNREVMQGSFYRNYVHEFALDGFYDRMIIASLFSRYLNKSGQTDCTLILPESKEQIIATCVPENQSDSMLYASTQLSYYIVRLPIEEDYQQFSVSYSGYATTIVDKCKDKIMHRQARPYTIDLIERRQFNDDNWRYVIVSATADKREVRDIRLNKK